MSAAEIAKKLTPAQRAALLWLKDDGTNKWLAGDGYTPEKKPRKSVLNKLAEQKLTAALSFSAGSEWKATALGLEVRAALAGGTP